MTKTATIEIFKADLDTNLELPWADGGIRAGFPSPAQDYVDTGIDLNRELIHNPSSTFYARVKGNSMIDAGINDGDLLVIDKSLEPRDGDMAICFIDGEFTLKFIRIEVDAIYLVPANSEFKPLKVTEENHFYIWGIVTYSIKQHKRSF